MDAAHFQRIAKALADPRRFEILQTIAASGDEMLVALGEAGRYPDLIIADYRLALGERGTDVIARLRHELGTPLPALLVSGDTSTEAIAAMRGRGLEVLSKPVLPQELKTLVRRLLARRPIATAGMAEDSAL